MNIKIEPIVIGEEKYFTVKQMATMTNKSDQMIYTLIKTGNAVRKMKFRKIADRVLIPCSELLDFPFTYAGFNAKENIYHYNKEGKIINGKRNL